MPYIEALDGLIAVLRAAERHADSIQTLERRAEIADPEQARRDLVEIPRASTSRSSLAPRRGPKRGGAFVGVSAWGARSFLALADLLEPCLGGTIWGA